jgi:hypothetical protein
MSTARFRFQMKRKSKAPVPRESKDVATGFTREGGVWVFRTGRPLPARTTDKVLQEIRNERDRMNMGKRR